MTRSAQLVKQTENSPRLIMGKLVSRPGSQNQGKTHGNLVNENKNTRMGVEENDKDQMETQSNTDAEFKIKKQKYTPHMRNEEYLILNPKSAKDEAEKYLYGRMVRSAVRLNKMFPSVKDMTDEVCVLGQSTNPGGDMKVDDSGTWVTCLFDNGADSGIHTEELASAIDLGKLEDKILTLQTINGTVKK